MYIDDFLLADAHFTVCFFFHCALSPSPFCTSVTVHLRGVIFFSRGGSLVPRQE